MHTSERKLPKIRACTVHALPLHPDVDHHDIRTIPGFTLLDVHGTVGPAHKFPVASVFAKNCHSFVVVVNLHNETEKEAEDDV